MSQHGRCLLLLKGLKCFKSFNSLATRNSSLCQNQVTPFAVIPAVFWSVLPSAPDVKSKLSLSTIQIFAFSPPIFFRFSGTVFLSRWAFTRLYLVLKRSLEVIVARLIKFYFLRLCVLGLLFLFFSLSLKIKEKQNLNRG